MSQQPGETRKAWVRRVWLPLTQAIRTERWDEARAALSVCRADLPPEDYLDHLGRYILTRQRQATRRSPF